MIVSSAVKLANGSVYVGVRHGDCFQHIFEINKLVGMETEEARKLHFDCVQGFINDKLVFLTREQAYYEAYECGQCKEQSYETMFARYIKGLTITKENWKPCLFSEDLW